MRDLLLEKGWRRHSVVSLRDDTLNQFIPHLPDKIKTVLCQRGAVLIVATYDCAVVSPCFDSEPWVQLLAAFPVTFEKKYSQGRDPRRLHFSIGHNDQSITFETNAACIAQLDRELLCPCQPDDEYVLPDSSKYDLKNWLAERFKQETWPDAFNIAIQPIQKRLKKFWARYTDCISSLYIKLDTYEEIPAGKYCAAIIIAIDVGKQRKLIQQMRSNNNQLKDKSMDEVISHLSSELIDIIGSTLDIEADPTMQNGKAVAVIEENGITVHQIRQFYRFSPYSMSEFKKESALPVDMLSSKSN